MRLSNTKNNISNQTSFASNKAEDSTLDTTKLDGGYKIEHVRGKQTRARNFTCDYTYNEESNLKLKPKINMNVIQNQLKNIQDLKSKTRRKYTFDIKKLVNQERRKYYAKAAQEEVSSSSPKKKDHQEEKKNTLRRGNTIRPRPLKAQINRKTTMINSSKDNVCDDQPTTLEADYKPRKFLSPIPGKRTKLQDTTDKNTTSQRRNLYNGVLVAAKGYTLYLNKDHTSATTPLPDRRRLPKINRRMNRKVFSPSPIDTSSKLPSLPENIKAGLCQKMKALETKRNISSPINVKAPSSPTENSSTLKNPPLDK